MPWERDAFNSIYFIKFYTNDYITLLPKNDNYSWYFSFNFYNGSNLICQNKFKLSETLRVHIYKIMHNPVLYAIGRADTTLHV